jgi:3-deoxy-D-manno-octulosonic-acid transferase
MMEIWPMFMQEGRRRRVESLANALSVLSENERHKLGELVDILQQIISKL